MIKLKKLFTEKEVREARKYLEDKTQKQLEELVKAKRLSWFASRNIILR